MDEDVKQAINNLAIEMDRLRGQVAALTAYVAATANSPSANLDTIKGAAREASPSRLGAGGPASPGDHAEKHIDKIVYAVGQLQSKSD